MVEINKQEHDLARMHQVTLSSVLTEEDIERLGVDGDTQLFLEAHSWLKAHPNYCLVDVGFHQASIESPREEGTRLILYVEPL